MDPSQREKTAVRVSLYTIIVNVLLAAFKLVAGIFGHSSAMVADALHSASDVLSSLIVIIGVKMSAKVSDEDHPYGHERMEPIAAMILSGILCATGLAIGYDGVRAIVQEVSEGMPVPGTFALAAAVLSVAVKEGMYRYTRIFAKKLNSGALMADAWHHRSDALSSVASFAGILGAVLGFPVLDPLAGAFVCLFVVKAAYGIFKDAVSKMTDRACDDKTQEAIRALVREHGDVLGIDVLRTRLFGDKIYVDMEICIDGGVTLKNAHDIAERVHDEIEEQFPDVKHCMIHVNPGALTMDN